MNSLSPVDIRTKRIQNVGQMHNRCANLTAMVNNLDIKMVNVNKYRAMKTCPMLN
jgi:hypothetical protein